MNRRSFLRWLGGTAAGAAAAYTLDIDKLLWVPGEKTIFLPPETILTLNTLITPDWITREAAMLFKNNLRVVGYFDAQA